MQADLSIKRPVHQGLLIVPVLARAQKPQQVDVYQGPGTAQDLLQAAGATPGWAWIAAQQ